MTEFQPDRTFPNRCISVHWSLPVQCERDKGHFDNWHWATHPDTGKRIRYRRTFGVYATEELGVGEWLTLQIPPPTRKDVAFLLSEVERLTAEGVAASERRDYFEARCEQMERDHAETVAERDRAIDAAVALEQENAHLRREPDSSDFADAIERLGDVFGWAVMGDLIHLLETVEVDGTLHVTDNEAGECVDDCTGCITERIAVAVVRALSGGERP